MFRRRENGGRAEAALGFWEERMDGLVIWGREEKFRGRFGNVQANPLAI
jgi:hypothetical protein